MLKHVIIQEGQEVDLDGWTVKHVKLGDIHAIPAQLSAGCPPDFGSQCFHLLLEKA